MREMVVYDSVAGSNLPVRKKSAVLDFLNQHAGSLSKRAVRHLHSNPQQNMLRHQGESVIFGGALGLVNATVGLDAGKKKNIPLDGVVAVGSIALGAFLASKGSGFATECNNLAASSLTVMAFRKSGSLLGMSFKPATSKVAGDDDEDPIVACAQGL